MSKLSLDQAKQLFIWMAQAREMDRIEQEYTGRGEAFFHVSGAGHEAAAALEFFLGPQDWLHVHYRDKALMLARGIPPSQFFLALFNKDQSHSRGRQMNAHMSSPELKVMSLTGPVGNNALHAVGAANAVKNNLGNPVVLCSMGDGMTQQGEALEALAHASRDGLPVLFLIQDNQFAISTVTKGKTFYDLPDREATEFHGIPIHRVNGRDPLLSYEAFEKLVTQMRQDRRPAILVFYVDRLDNHTNADDQRVYRPAEEIEAVRSSGDPIPRIQDYLRSLGVEQSWFDQTVERLRQELRQEAKKAQRSPEPKAVHTALKPLEGRFFDKAAEYRGNPEEGQPKLTMLEAIRETLKKRLQRDERVTLFGEDLEDPKGDVFGITKGLSTAFPGRVKNSPLAEASIVGISIGEALAGRRPVAFLQFADFLPIAYNQIVSELASMYWRTDGGWQCPVIVMITCGGYRPGLGPFHASSFEALAVHTPGVDVMMPSTAGDAAGLLNAAFESGRPTLFFYPKNCLNDPTQATSTDIEKHFVPLGRARLVREGKDLTLVGYGNTVSLCRKAAEILSDFGVEAEILDLRCLMPWDRSAVLQSAEKTGRLIVVHEDNKSAGMGAEIMAEVLEHAHRPVQARRVVRDDTFVPCNYGNQLEVLPGYKRIVDTAVEMLGGKVTWKAQPRPEVGVFFVPAIGSSPSDESITVVQWKIKEGDTIAEGQLIADMEADKAAFDLRSPVSGVVEKILVGEGDTVGVGSNLLQVRVGEEEAIIKPITREEPGEPTIELPPRETAAAPQVVRKAEGLPLLQAVSVRKGSRIVTNAELARLSPSWNEDEILKRVGIESRPWVAEGENALTLSVDSAQRLLEETGLSAQDIDLIICATGTPIHFSPSLAGMVQHELSKRYGDLTMPCYDLSSACSGYLYGLAAAYDYLANHPEGRVLLINTEVLSPRVDMSDFGTAPIFADASTASLILGSALAARASKGFWVHRPIIGAQGEDGSALRVPAGPREFIVMDGPRVYLEAVKWMTASSQQALDQAKLTVEDISLVIPHQANQRIINAVRQKLHIPAERVFSNIRENGNTSSCTIPIGLNDVWQRIKPSDRILLVAFGGGFTYGAGILERS